MEEMECRKPGGEDVQRRTDSEGALRMHGVWQQDQHQGKSLQNALSGRKSYQV